MHKRLFNIILLCLFCLCLASCSIKRRVPEGKYLIKKNNIEIDSSRVAFSKSDLSSYITQKPYKGFMGTNFKIWMYYVTEKHTDKKLWKWMNETIGTVPEYYEKTAANNSSKQMELYLENVGYFNSKVSNSVKYKRFKATVNYKIKTETPYRVKQLDYVIPDTTLSKYVFQIKDQFPMKVGEIYNAYTLDDERDLIANYLKNNGYYFFTRDYIFFEVDSSFLDHTMHVTMRIDNVKNRFTNKTEPHKRYFINEINIFPNYSAMAATRKPTDSTSIDVTVGRKRELNTLNFFFYGNPRIRPQTFAQVVQIQKDMPYRMKTVSQTYNRLNELKIYSSSNIEFDTIHSSIDTMGLLNCRINLRRSTVNSYTIQGEGTNSGGDLGIRGSISYTNKNIFRGAEVLRLTIKGGLEAQKIVEIAGLNQDEKAFNTREFNFNASLFFPRFLSFIPMKNFIREYQPKTSINLGYNTQIRYAYSRYISAATFGYDWKSNPQLQHILTPIYLNSVKVNPIPSFQALLDKEENQRIKDQYTNHLILGSRYSFIYSDQDLNKNNNFLYLRTNLESSGNILSLFNSTPLISKENNYHELFGIRYAQYVRADFDFRQYLKLKDDLWLVLRELVGFGIPYGNSKDLPFERCFYAGGANGMRGWPYRGLGPGGFVQDSLDVERIGDIQLEFNAELRFPIYSYLSGAIFTDIGNIWTYNENNMLPNGEFKLKNFYKQLAMDAGFGIRVDISFIILRLDWAVPIRYPYPDSDGVYWNFKDMKLTDIRWNFGIGYPF